MPPVTSSARAVAALLGDWRSEEVGTLSDALADGLRVLVLDGRLSVATRLPAERGLAEELGVSRATVARAYETLRGDGYLESLRGSGSVVRLPREPGAVDTGLAGDAAGAGVLDLRRTVLRAAPGLVEAAERAMLVLPSTLAQPGYDAVGDPGLRAAIADRYTERGLPTTAEQVMVTLGAQHAIALLARVLVRPRSTVLIEAPTYPHAHAAYREAGARFVAVPVDAEDGWDAELLVAALRRVRPVVVHVMPDLHNPTGATMPSAVRVALLETAAEVGATVVADETLGELRLEGDVEPPLATIGPAVLIGSTSKVFWGALRIGWIRADTALLQRLQLARSRGDLGTPLLEQLVVRELIPRTAEVLAARRLQLTPARDAVVAALRTTFPSWTVPSPAGGLTTWVHLGRPRSGRLVLAARREGLLLASGAAFGPHGGFDRFLRIPYAVAAADRDRFLTGMVRAWAAVDGQTPGEADPLPVVV